MLKQWGKKHGPKHVVVSLKHAGYVTDDETDSE